ncbi:ABC transporter, ATP-binding protein [Ancylostoma duodenale]|uniref:ABC transporter, ATP-binding protein n=1 Tax=Ancylostoma duodenale TaxID=51022 RepID=A0A0C2GST7_9BILA|nr:ABC transporter, ATP-binding protein [Ancylostoma duodenale]
MIVSKFATISQGCFYAQKLSLLKAFRLAECKSRIPLSRRADHLSRQYLNNEEPSLALSDVWSLIRPYWFWFLAAVVSAVLAAVVNIQLPLYLGELIDKIVQLIKDQSRGSVGDLAIIKPQAIKLVLCYTAQAVLTFFYISFLTVLGERMAADLRKTAELTSRLNVDVQEFKSCFKLTVAQGLRTLAQVGGCVVSLFRISPQMTMYTVAALPLVIAIGTLFGALLRSLSRRAQAQSAVAAAVADEALGNIQTVRAFAMEEQESRLLMLISCLGNALRFSLEIIAMSFYRDAKRIVGEMTPGELMSFLVTAQTIQRSLSQLSIVFGNAVKGWTAGARVFQFANLRPSVRIDDGVCIPYHTLWGEVRFEDVGFAYPTRPEHHVFEKLNLTIPAGQIVALCGPSGEEPVLFATSIEENIRYGRPSATQEEVMQAAQLANAHEFISKFPDGYNTIVGERGTQLSGGQKQRIAIARALLKNPPILVLDEATSALDAESERSVRDALDRAMKGRTVLIIAHRLSTIRNANLICVVKDKKIPQQLVQRRLARLALKQPPPQEQVGSLLVSWSDWGWLITVRVVAGHSLGAVSGVDNGRLFGSVLVLNRLWFLLGGNDGGLLDCFATVWCSSGHDCFVSISVVTGFTYHYCNGDVESKKMCL